MSIIAVVNPKGGVGKSTLACGLAARRARDAKVKLIDADRQASSDTWRELRKNSNGLPPVVGGSLYGRIYEDLRAEREAWPTVIVDCPGSDSGETRAAMAAADLILVPIDSGQFSISALGDMCRLIDQMRDNGADKPVLGVLNNVPPGWTREAADALQMLAGLHEYLTLHKQVVWKRASVSLANRSGMCVHELMGSDRDDKAVKELESIYKEVFNHGIA